MTTSLFLNLLVNTIIKSYFENDRCMFLLSEPGGTFDYRGGVIPVVHLNIINESIDEKLVFRSYGCQRILIQHHNVAAVLTDIEEKMKLHSDRFNYRKYLIIPSPRSSENLTDIFGLPIIQYIANILIVTPEQQCEECNSVFEMFCSCNESFQLITNKYSGESGNNDPVVLDLWFSNNQSFLYGTNVYPDKISNQNGRILRSATMNYKPYSIIDKSPPIAKGSENNLAYEYAKRHNVTIQYILDDNAWGIIYENWTGNGLLGNIATDKADIGFGSIYAWEHEYGFLDLSKPVVRTGVTCLVPAPRLAAGWLTPFFPFSMQMWIGVGISYVVASVVTTNLIALLLKSTLQQKNINRKIKLKSKTNYRKLYSESLFMVFRIFLTQSLPTIEEEVERVFKYMFVMFLFSLLITSTYSSGLASVMTLPRYEGAINTVWDLANSGINWGATEDAWLYSLVAEERPQYLTLVNRFITASAEDLMKFAKTDRFAFSIERLPSGQYAIGSYITEDIVRKLTLLHEDLYWEYCVFMLRKNSPLLNSLDNIILQLTEAGIIKFWEMRAAEIHMDLRVQNIVKYYADNKDEDRDDAIKLQWVHVEGAFAILGAGYVVAIVCFFIEMLSCNRKLQKTKRTRFTVDPI